MHKIKQYKTLRHVGLDIFGNLLLFSKLYTQRTPKRRRTLNVAMRMSPERKDVIFSGSSQTSLLLRYQYGNLRRKFLYSVLKKGSAGDVLFLTERRLDTFLFRTGIVNSYSHARQLISHGKILVNCSPVTSSKYLLNAGDLVGVSALEYNGFVHSFFSVDLSRKSWCNLPKYILFDYKQLAGIFLYSPTFLEIPFPVNTL